MSQPDATYTKDGYTPVTVQPGATHTTIIQTTVRPSDYLAFAVFSCICCNAILGVVAIIFSCLSRGDADNGELDAARTKGKISLAMSLIGLISTIIIVAILIVVYVVLPLVMVKNLSVQLSESGFNMESSDGGNP
ncbi:unnamed protein product [Owenia fusiformis]|uniref:Uncharacterized protein n=1 Tax=Owenia fusiformis TaxID=6347 RepID=A0A8S4NC35_OWEFU|nr:unnamed protein product [Owenia fusiformis]